DLDMGAARTRAAEFGLKAMSVEDMLADPAIEIIVNLTTPQAHIDIDLQALANGKHVHSEKPLAISTAAVAPLQAALAGSNLRVGCAPDTFLGGGQQTARQLLDQGRIGDPVAGSAHIMLPGHERWHPNPDFYYQQGGGPMLDMGPYYLTALINLLGPIARISGAVRQTYDQRTIGGGPRAGEQIPVDVSTHISGIIEFASGVLVDMTASFDVWKHQHNHIEIYGTKGAMVVPDPNRFDGSVLVAEKNGDWEEIAPRFPYTDGNYRIIGVADLAHAIRTGRPHRANFDIAYHVLEAMDAFEISAQKRAAVDLGSSCDRPAALDPSLAEGLLD
ncbi:MAG: Gfo/Idh/MocA family protein, partial [Alphaproteobacteria bacterium]